MSENLFTPTNAQVSDAESLSYIFKKLLSEASFIEIAIVTAVRGEAPNLVVDVKPLVTQLNQSKEMIPNSEVYSIPVFRLQRGGSAIIMNPVPGDIGFIAMCDRDTSLARANRKESVPGSRRTHSKSDGIYLGGLLNMPPEQFLEFADNAINITSPNLVNITCSKANITAPDGVEMTTPLLKVSGAIQANGDITDNAASQLSTMKQLREAYNKHTHEVKGVQGGNDNKTSEKPGNSV